MSVIIVTNEAGKVLSDFLRSRDTDLVTVLLHIDAIIGDYLKTSLPASIKIEWPDKLNPVGDEYFTEALAAELLKPSPRREYSWLLAQVKGWGDSRGSRGWTHRARQWYLNRSTLALVPKDGKLMLVSPLVTGIDTFDTLNAIPVYLSSLDLTIKKGPDTCEETFSEGVLKGLATAGRSSLTSPATCGEISLEGTTTGRSSFASPMFPVGCDTKTTDSTTTTESKEQMTKAITIPTAFSTAVEQNKEAVQLAAKLSVGKTANAFLVDALTSKLPWYAKLFGQKQAIKDNPLTKVATAQLANLLAQHFAKDNAKVTYVADAMLQEAMVDLITNADVVNDLITKLGSFAGDLTGDSVK